MVGIFIKEIYENTIRILLSHKRYPKYAKYQKIYNHQVEKYKKCTKIVLGKCGGWDAAFLIQNAFPTTADYFDHIHTSKGIPLTLHGGTAKLISDNLKNNLRLHKRGISLFYADIDRIYNIMVKKISDKKAIYKASLTGFF